MGRRGTIEAERAGKIAADLLVCGDLLLTMRWGDEIFSNGAVAIAGNRIVAVGPTRRLAKAVDSEQQLDASGCLIMPGLINLHTHAAMTCFRGLADDLPLDRWLQEHIFPAETAHMDEEAVYWGTLLAVAEMIRGGTTTFCDGYFHESGAARAVAASGIRAILAEGVIDYPGGGPADDGAGLEAAAVFIDRWPRDLSRLKVGIFCHTPYTCSPRTLSRAKEICRKHDLLFQIHLAETRREVEEVRSRYGRSPVEHLLALGVLDSRTLCHHAVWVDQAELELLAEQGVAISHNPESNMKLASGVAPLPEMLSAGLKVGLGTDGCASNNNLDMWQEMDMAAKLHKVHLGDPALCPAGQILEMATRGGAAALGLADEIGSLEPGKLADLITIDLDRPHLTPMYDPVSHLVYAAAAADVRDVIINGEVMVRQRRVLSIDEAEVMARVREIAGSIQKAASGPDRRVEIQGSIAPTKGGE